jgi:hypothetical protein
MAVAAAPPAMAENGSLLFDGTDDYVTVPEPVDITGPITVETWVKVDAAISAGRIVSNRQGSDGYEIDVHGSGGTYTARFIINGNAAAIADFTPRVGVWTHLAGIWDGPGIHTAHIYIDGALAGTGWADGMVSSPGPLRIGAPSSGFFFFHGQIDEVRIWSAALDGATIASWMSRPLTVNHPNHGSLEAYWNFDDGSGQVLHNQTGDARRDGELGSGSGADANDPQWQREGAPVPVDATTMGRIKQRYLKP